MKNHPPYLRLVHSQPAENCVTVVQFRSFNWPLVVALAGCIAFHAACGYGIWRILTCVSTNQQ